MSLTFDDCSVKKIEQMFEVEYSSGHAIQVYVCEGQLEVVSVHGNNHTFQYRHVVAPGGLLKVVRRADFEDVVTYNDKPMAVILYNDDGIEVYF